MITHAALTLPYPEKGPMGCNLVDLKIKSKAPVQIYFMFQVFQEHSYCYDKRKN